MPIFHVDQRPARERCLAALARDPAVARVELLQILGSVRRTPGATPAGVVAVLLELHGRGDRAACRRLVERAIPVRGTLRAGRLGAAQLATVAALAALWWIAPAFAAVAAAGALAGAAIWVVVASAPARRMAGLERAASAAAQRGDGAALAAIAADAHRMIADDRVFAGTGRRMVAVLRATVDAEPYPEELLDDLRRLRELAPEVLADHDDVERMLAHQLERRRGRDATAEGARRSVLADYRRLRDAAVERDDDDRIAALIAGMRRASAWADHAGDAAILGELHDDARALIERGRIPTGSGTPLAEVLRDRAGVAPFAMKVLTELDALRALAPEVEPAIVAAAIDRIEARLEAITNRPALHEIAATFEKTAATASDPAIAGRARDLAARAAALGERPGP